LSIEVPKVSKKDSLSFSCGVFDEKYPQVLAITPFVNDVSLSQLVSEFEKARGYEPAGGYNGIVPKWFKYGPLEKYFLGEHDPDSYWAKLGAEYILGCECGEVGCWPLECRIKIQSEDVIWHRFRQPHRSARDYSQFGPFVFAGAQYRDALTKLVAQMSEFTGESM
jgi:hypothetical protein